MIQSSEYFPECSSITTPLYAHQVDAIKWMHEISISKKGCILSDGMGLGKTRTTAFSISLYPVPRTLISTPKSVVYQWLRELIHTCPSHDVYCITALFAKKAYISQSGKIYLDEGIPISELMSKTDHPIVCVCTYHAVVPNPPIVDTPMQTAKQIELGADVRQYIPENTPFNSVIWDRFVVDEVHTLRNGTTCSIDRKKSRPKTLKFVRFYRVRMSSIGIRIGLSGTPIQNRISDMVSLFNWLHIDLPKKTDSYTLKSLMKVHIFRRTELNLHQNLLDIISFPKEPYQNNIVTIKYRTLEEQQFYETVSGCISGERRTALMDITYKAVVREQYILVVINMLRFLSANANMFLRIYNKMHNVCLPAWVGSETKNELIIERLRVLSEEKESAIVFVHFYEETALILGELQCWEAKNGTYLYDTIYFLNGETSMEDREFILYQSKIEIEDGKRVLIFASIASCCEGLNMQHFCNILIATPDWNPCMEDQAIGRSYRIGQKKQVRVWRFVHEIIIQTTTALMEKHKNDIDDGGDDDDEEEEEEEKDDKKEEKHTQIQKHTKPPTSALNSKHIDGYMVGTQHTKKEIISEYIYDENNAAYLYPRILMPNTSDKAVHFNVVIATSNVEIAMGKLTRPRPRPRPKHSVMIKRDIQPLPSHIIKPEIYIPRTKPKIYIKPEIQRAPQPPPPQIQPLPKQEIQSPPPPRIKQEIQPLPKQETQPLPPPRIKQETQTQPLFRIKSEIQPLPKQEIQSPPKQKQEIQPPPNIKQPPMSNEYIRQQRLLFYSKNSNL